MEQPFLYFISDFYKIGGFAIFPICYSSENEEVRCNASRILAELCQNNSFCQERALETGLLNIILHMVTTERGSALAKCVSAVSSKLITIKNETLDMKSLIRMLLMDIQTF